MPIEKFCKVCGGKFYCKPSHINRAKYCSKSCRSKDCGFQKGNQVNKGHVSHRKGKKLSKEHIQNMRKAMKERKIQPQQGFQKGNISFKKRRNYIGENNPNWKGGKIIQSGGYIFIKKPNHPNANIRGYVHQSHLIMEKYLGRFLNPKEVTHHINGIKTDDRIENLNLFKNQSEHTKFHSLSP